MERLSEGPVRITKATVEAAWKRRRKGLRLTIRDMECRGLALVVNPTVMTWNVSYKPRGLDPSTGRRPASRELVIGVPAELTPDQAREKAVKVKGGAKVGGDPAAERRAAIAKAARERAATASAVMQDYKAALPKRPKLRGTGTLGPRVVAEEVRNLRLAFDTMKANDRPVTAIGATDLRALLTAEALPYPPPGRLDSARRRS
jgi:hypothetical protein